MAAEKHALEANLAYLSGSPTRVEHRVYPLASSRATVRPEQNYRRMPVTDARTLPAAPALDEAGFMLVGHETAVVDLYDDEAVRRDYYPEIAALLEATLGALTVIVFDHNQRSARRAAAGQAGVRTPVEAAHVDYTPASGPRRAREILADAGREDLAGHRLALVNAWRPIVGPVRDFPLAVCDARSAAPADYVQTDIHHFGEDDLEQPRHSGQIYSMRFNPAHRWYFYSDMRPDEVLLLRNWDSAAADHRGYAPHTGFKSPLAGPGDVPRESIEARTLVVYP